MTPKTTPKKPATDAKPAAVAETKKKNIGLPSFTLVRFPQGIFRDIYGNPDKLVPRMRWVNSAVSHVIKAIADSDISGDIVITDFYRKPSESYIALHKKGGMVAPPGLSGHNYGLSMDIAVDATCTKTGLVRPLLAQKLSELSAFGIPSEAWHYNFMFRVAHEYFFSLFDTFPEKAVKKIKSSLISTYSANIAPVTTVKALQADLGLKADGVLGKRTILAVTMLLAEKQGLLKGLDDAKKQKIVVDFNDIWG